MSLPEAVRYPRCRIGPYAIADGTDEDERHQDHTNSAAALVRKAAILTLSCDGTVTNLVWHSDHKPEPVTNMGLVVNLSEGTVTGFSFPARIYKTDATRVEFKGESGNWSVWGSIDRVTSTVKASTTVLYPISIHSWGLVCKP